MAAARGEIVARMDADDIAAPTRLEEQLALLDADATVAACGTGVEYFPDEVVRNGARRYQAWINRLVSHDQIARDIFVECPIAHPTLMIRRHVLLAVGGYREMGWPEDYDLVLRIWAGGYRMGKVPDKLLRWREYPGRASRTHPRYAPEAFLRLKVHHLKRTLLAGGREAVIMGAGPTGKKLALALQEEGVAVVAFVDVDPARIGQEIHDAPVIDLSELERYARPGEAQEDALVIGAVGQEGARSEIRAQLTDRGMQELDDFVVAA